MWKRFCRRSSCSQPTPRAGGINFLGFSYGKGRACGWGQFGIPCGWFDGPGLRCCALPPSPPSPSPSRPRLPTYLENRRVQWEKRNEGEENQINRLAAPPPHTHTRSRTHTQERRPSPPLFRDRSLSACSPSLLDFLLGSLRLCFGFASVHNINNPPLRPEHDRCCAPNAAAHCALHSGHTVRARIRT